MSELRICPGRHVADGSVWIVLATMLSTATISKPKDENGREITPEIAFEASLSAYVMFLLCETKIADVVLPAAVGSIVDLKPSSV
jgi:hypothetical protein